MVPRPFRLALLMAGLVVPLPLSGQIQLVDGDAATLRLGGYIRTLTGIHDLGYSIPATAATATTPRTSGFNGEVVRLKWQLAGGAGTAGSGTSWEMDVHNRVQARVTSSAGGDQVVGFGVSAVPNRIVDLESEIVNEPGVRVWHDLDRLSLSVYTDVVDITVGRQPITWGISGIFPVADLWAQFSPFELDTEEKPGIDAVRVLAYPAGIELDAVVADRGRARDLSFGVRGTYGFSSADVWLGAGKLWREAMAMGGVTVLLDQAKLRAEAVLPWDMDAETLQDPRITLGVDWIRGTLTLTGEYHYNGIAADHDSYLATLQDPRVQRGETYYLGTHYLGALVTWSPDLQNRLNLILNALTNLEDPSLALTPALSYDLGQSTRFALGGLLSFGDPPSFSPLPPSFPTEFGAYGTLGYTQLSIYF